MRRAAKFKQADVERAIRASVAAGLEIKAVEIAVDGSVRVLTHGGQPGVALNENDDWVDLAGSTQDHRRA